MRWILEKYKDPPINHSFQIRQKQRDNAIKAAKEKRKAAEANKAAARKANPKGVQASKECCRIIPLRNSHFSSYLVIIHSGFSQSN